MQDLTIFITNHPFLSLATAVIFVLLMVVELIRARRKVFDITPSEATQMINHDNAVVIDLRPNDVYRNGHIINAISMLPQDIKDAKKIEKFRARTIILICTSGIESQKIAAQLLKRGYNAYSLAGGLRAWSEAQMPLIKE